MHDITTTETQRTQRLHREIQNRALPGAVCLEIRGFDDTGQPVLRLNSPFRRERNNYRWRCRKVQRVNESFCLFSIVFRHYDLVNKIAKVAVCGASENPAIVQ